MAKRKKTEGEQAAAKAAADKRPVTIDLCHEFGEDGSGKIPAMPYKIMRGLIEDRHRHLIDAAIVICWRLSNVAQDVDGQREFGRVVRCTDLMRALLPWDFVIVLSHGIWNTAEASPNKMAAMMDWLLQQCMPVDDPKTHEQVVDEKDRLVWRNRKPLKVYSENVAAFGFWNAPELGSAHSSFRQMSLLGDPDGEPVENLEEEPVGA